MKSVSWKRMLLIGFVVILLVAIPLTLYVLKQQQDARTRATPATVLSFSPTSSSSAPMSNKVGDAIPLDVTVNPGTNLVNTIKVEIQYDPTKLSTSSGGFVPNAVAFPTVLSGPTYSPGKIDVNLSTGFNTTSAISTITKVGTVTFSALAATDQGTPTSVTFNTTVSSVNSLGSGDLANENVLSTTQPAFIALNASAIITPTNTPTPTTPVVSPTATPTTPVVLPTATPTGIAAPTAIPTVGSIPVSTATPTLIAIATNTTIPTATIAATGSTNITFGIGAFLTVLTVIGGIIFFVL